MKSFSASTVFRGHTRPVSNIKFSPDGTLLASCSGDRSIRLWPVGSHDAVSASTSAVSSVSTPAVCVSTLTGHAAGVSDIAWSSTGSHICSASDDKTLNLTDVQTGAVVRSFVGHSSYVSCVAFNSPSDNLIASGSHDESLHLWDSRSAKSVRVIAAHSEPITGVQFAADGQLGSSSFDCSCRIWDLGSGQMLTSLPKFDRDPVIREQNENHPISSLQFSSNSKFVLLSTFDSIIRLWDWRTQQCVKSYRGHTNGKFAITSIFTAFDQQQSVVSASEDHKIVMWNVQSKEIVQTLTGHEGIVMSVASHPTRPILASCSFDLTVRLWTCEQQ